MTYRWSTGQPWGGPGTGTSHTAIVMTDTAGFAHARATWEHYLGIEVAVPGFYHCFVTVPDADLASHTGGDVALPIPLKRIISPHPLVAKKARVILPGISGEAAYDFLAGDLVAPFGTGKNPDCKITWSRPPGNSKIEERKHYDILFSDSNAGIMARKVTNDRTIVESDLRSEISAPSSGYGSSMRKSETIAGFGVRGHGATNALSIISALFDTVRLYMARYSGSPRSYSIRRNCTQSSSLPTQSTHPAP